MMAPMMQKDAPQPGRPEGTGDALANARLAAIVESSFDAIISKDLDGIITSWNPAAERLYGYSADEAIGQSILIVIPETHRHEEETIIARIRDGQRIDTFETIRRRRDGSLVPVSLTVSPIRTADGQIIGASKIARDISESRESESRIRLLLREVNHRVKNQYAVILSMVRESLKHTSSPAEFEAKLRQRIMALASSQDLLVKVDWKGVPLEALVLQQIEPFGGLDRITVSGPAVRMRPEAVQSLGMALHELATNSARYGVLAHGGTIAIDSSTPAKGSTHQRESSRPSTPCSAASAGTAAISTPSAIRTGTILRNDIGTRRQNGEGATVAQHDRAARVAGQARYRHWHGSSPDSSRK